MWVSQCGMTVWELGLECGHSRKPFLRSIGGVSQPPELEEAAARPFLNRWNLFLPDSHLSNVCLLASSPSSSRNGTGGPEGMEHGHSCQ